MKKSFLVWNVNACRPVTKRPLSHNRAGKLADILEVRRDAPMLVIPA